MAGGNYLERDKPATSNKHKCSDLRGETMLWNRQCHPEFSVCLSRLRDEETHTGGVPDHVLGKASRPNRER